jgi:hypothetical protein
MLKCIIKPHTSGGHYIKTQKTNKRMMARTFPGETTRGRPKKGQKTHSPKGPKRGRELVSLATISY